MQHCSIAKKEKEPSRKSYVFKTSQKTMMFMRNRVGWGEGKKIRIWAWQKKVAPQKGGRGRGHSTEAELVPFLNVVQFFGSFPDLKSLIWKKKKKKIHSHNCWFISHWKRKSFMKIKIINGGCINLIKSYTATGESTPLSVPPKLHGQSKNPGSNEATSPAGGGQEHTTSHHTPHAQTVVSLLHDLAGPSPLSQAQQSVLPKRQQRQTVVWVLHTPSVPTRSA